MARNKNEKIIALEDVSENDARIYCIECAEDDSELLPLTEDDLGQDYIGVCDRCGKRIN